MSNIDGTVTISNFRQVSEFFSKPSSWRLYVLQEKIMALLLKIHKTKKNSMGKKLEGFSVPWFQR